MDKYLLSGLTASKSTAVMSIAELPPVPEWIPAPVTKADRELT